MLKVDSTVKKETLYITAWVLVLSAVLEAVFLIIGLWDLNVLFGNLLGIFGAIANFFLMGLAVQKAVGTDDEKQASSIIRASQAMRLFMLFIVLAIGVMFFNPISVIIPLFIPRIAVGFRPLFDKKSEAVETAKSEQ